MADKPASPPKSEQSESAKAYTSEVAPEAPPPPPPPSKRDHFLVDVALRVLLFASTAVSVVVMVTSKQTELVPVPSRPSILIPLSAKFTQSPAFIYFVAALSVACLYSIITILASLCAIVKPAFSVSYVLRFHFVLVDVLMLGLVASATGTAGGVGYIGLKGNSHVQWGKICNRYDTFCQHIGASIAISLFASVVLVLLIMLSLFSLRSKLRS